MYKVIVAEAMAVRPSVRAGLHDMTSSIAAVYKRGDSGQLYGTVCAISLLVMLLELADELLVMALDKEVGRGHLGVVCYLASKEFPPGSQARLQGQSDPQRHDGLQSQWHSAGGKGAPQ
jgi:hypothetical protein